MKKERSFLVEMHSQCGGRKGRRKDCLRTGLVIRCGIMTEISTRVAEKCVAGWGERETKSGRFSLPKMTSVFQNLWLEDLLIEDGDVS